MYREKKKKKTTRRVVCEREFLDAVVFIRLPERIIEFDHEPNDIGGVI
jgi:hypothetical protein